MHLSSWRVALLIVLVLLVPAVRASEVRMPIPGHGTLLFDVPDGWAADVSPHAFGPSYLLKLSSSADGNDRLVLTVSWLADGRSPSIEEIRKSIATVAQKASERAVDGSVELRQLEEAQLLGAYVRMQMKDAGPRQFRHRLQGTAAREELLLHFTALSTDGADSFAAQALKVLGTARRLTDGPPATPRPTPESRLTVTQRGDHHVATLAASRLALEVPRDRWTPDGWGLQMNGPRYFFFSPPQKSGAVRFSGWIEPSARFTSLAELAAGVSTGMRDVRHGTRGPWQTVSYVMEPMAGFSMTYLHAHLVRAGSWIEVKMSLDGIPEAEREARPLDALDALRVVEKP